MWGQKSIDLSISGVINESVLIFWGELMPLLTTTIKSFFKKKGYGFLVNPHGGEDIYFKKARVKALDGNRFRDWKPNEKKPVPEQGRIVRFCVRNVSGKPQAIELAIVS